MSNEKAVAGYLRDDKPVKVVDRPEPKPTPYKYEVVQPCHRDGFYFDPTNPKAELPMHHHTAEPQVSAALVPADDFTRKATEEQAKKFAEVRRQNELKAHPELAALVRENAEMKSRVDQLLGALEKQIAKK